MKCTASDSDSDVGRPSTAAKTMPFTAAIHSYRDQGFTGDWQCQTRSMTAEEVWVQVVPHDACWAGLYQEEAATIRSALGTYALGMEHFGSTAVPGLLAKPIIDILVGTREGAGPDTAIAGLNRLGYAYLGEDGRRPGRYFWRKRGINAFNVSVVPHDGALWRSNLAVRDFLRTHPGWADRYGQVKVKAASVSEHSMLGYQDHKREFVDALRAASMRWADEHSGDGC
jgi:GrpB-like predicted nucleotidyltransferase (UPF0157 family)